MNYNSYIKILVGLCICWMLLSCVNTEKKSLSVNPNVIDSLDNTIPKDLFIQKVHVNHTDYLLRFVPLEEMVEKSEGIQSKDSLWKEKLSDYQRYLYFEIRIDKPLAVSSKQEAVNGENIINERTEYLSFYAQQDFFLVQQKDTLACQIYQLESSFGATPFYQVHLGFDNRFINKDFKVLFFDKDIDPAFVSFTFPKTLIIDENK